MSFNHHLLLHLLLPSPSFLRFLLPLLTPIFLSFFLFISSTICGKREEEREGRERGEEESGRPPHSSAYLPAELGIKRTPRRGRTRRRKRTQQRKDRKEEEREEK
ncbi:hypothetical protein CSUI_003928 [Cystoisospora suis]|uniref:Transmembrane protein n=1 Tax=Cystoisospora suis TaxID=483139 RepID=A0A2C6L2F9_9APIC|nr:hypothetical protein CSUI_003928 [Cystoisospora suis]